MGKSQEEGGKRPVKREVVSASTSLEVVSEENFTRRLQGMSQCLNCQKERCYLTGSSTQRHHNHNNNNNGRHHHVSHHHHNSGSGSSSNNNNHNSNNNRQGRRSKQGRRKQTKSNTPIVIHLKDTLRSVLQQQRQRSFDTDSDVSVRSTDDDQSQDAFGDVSSIPEFVPQYMHHHPYQARTYQMTQPYSTSSYQHPCTQQRREKSKKNLTALISVIEKAHHKESVHTDCNLAGPGTARSKLCHVLNNALTPSDKSHGSQRRIVKCNNVDVICNDLHKSEKSPEAVDDTDSISDRSSVASSSDALSDSDSQVVEEGGSAFEFTPDELQRLAEFTTGYPIYRYDCSPAECPECLSTWYSHQIYQYEGCSMDTATSQRGGSRYPTSRADRQRSGSHPAESELDTTLEGSDNEGDAFAEDSGVASDFTTSGGSHPGEGRRRTVSSSSSSGHSYLGGQPVALSSSSAPSSPTAGEAVWPWRKGGRQLWDIDVSQAARRGLSGAGSAGAGQPEVGSLAESVYLDLTGTDVAISVYYHASLLQDEAVRSAVAASMITPSHVYAAASSLYSIYYSSYMATPVYGLSLPLSFFNDSALPKVAMVPPHEFKNFQQSHPPPRQWIANPHPGRTQPSGTFTVLCYNVLCDKYCTRQQYGYCPTWALNWEYRKKGILEEVRNLQADIISLQEVETDQFYNFFMVELSKCGYDGIFAPKSRARTMTEHERKHVDGCAIFYKKEKFRLVEEKLVEFSQVALASAANTSGNDDMLNRVGTKDNIGLCALLETKPAIFENSLPPPEALMRQLLLVSTAHIHWDPEFSDVKMVQTMMLMWELQQFVEDATRKYTMTVPGPYNCNSIPLVFCGDLNSLPDSGVIEFLGNGKVANNHIDFKDNMYEVYIKKMCNGDRQHIYHNFQLQQAYQHIMPYTNYTYDFKGIIDYIFHTQGRLQVLGQLGPYDQEWFRENKVLGCPHPHVPSDHFSLMVEFEMLIEPPPVSRNTPHITHSAHNTHNSHHNKR